METCGLSSTQNNSCAKRNHQMRTEHALRRVCRNESNFGRRCDARPSETRGVEPKPAFRFNGTGFAIREKLLSGGCTIPRKNTRAEVRTSSLLSQSWTPPKHVWAHYNAPKIAFITKAAQGKAAVLQILRDLLPGLLVICGILFERTCLSTDQPIEIGRRNFKHASPGKSKEAHDI